MSGVAKAELIPNEPLRKAFQASGMSAYELGRRLERDPRTIARRLGLVRRSQADGRRYVQTQITCVMAESIAVELGVDPVDIGL